MDPTQSHWETNLQDPQTTKPGEDPWKSAYRRRGSWHLCRALFSNPFDDPQKAD